MFYLIIHWQYICTEPNNKTENNLYHTKFTSNWKAELKLLLWTGADLHKLAFQSVQETDHCNLELW